MGRARTLTETLAMLESILGVDFRQLSQNIASGMTEVSSGDDPAPTN